MLPITDEYVKFILEQNKHLMEQNDRLLEQNQQLNEQIAKLNITVDQLNETVKKLNERLNKNSKNSSKPPSSDGYNKPSPKSLRESSGKKKGGQDGHPGSYLKVMAKPDHTESYMPRPCQGCPHYEQCKSHAYAAETRHVVDINVDVQIIAHEALSVECPIRNATFKGAFPKEISAPVQYGDNLAALVVALNTVGALSVSRTNEILSGVFNVPIATGTISSMVTRCSDLVTPTVDKIGKILVEAYLMHCDETGTHVDGKTKWVHVACNKLITYLFIHNKRGKMAINENGLLSSFQGIAVHDCWSSYWSCDGTFEHAICCAHLLRELNGIIENYPEQEWAKRFIELLLSMKKSAEKAISEGKGEISYYQRRKISTLYEGILQMAYAENPMPESSPNKRGRRKKGKVRALIERLDIHRDEVCRFVHNLNVPFDNNQAERDIRMVKTKTKVSGCFRSDEGATAYLRIMSNIGTAKKHGINAFRAIAVAFAGNPDMVIA